MDERFVIGMGYTHLTVVALAAAEELDAGRGGESVRELAELVEKYAVARVNPYATSTVLADVFGSLYCRDKAGPRLVATRFAEALGDVGEHDSEVLRGLCWVIATESMKDSNMQFD